MLPLSPNSRRSKRRFFAALLALFLAPVVHAQSQGQDSEAISPVPVFTMGTGFITTFEGGTPHLGPLVAPLILVPVGQKWLFETRGTIEADLAPPPGSDDFKGSAEKSVDYVQLDYIANRYLTVTAGRYLIPFGIYNERLYPIWIRNLQTDPLILPIGGSEYGAGTGAMVRGGFDLAPRVELNYAAYFSAHSSVSHMESDRSAGGRAGIFLPGPRIELGGSFQHLLQEDRTNSFGFHFEWQPPPVPLDIRAEYARSHDGSGYWIESAYRLSQSPVWQSALRHVQVVARMQQFYAGAGESDEMADVDTNQFEFGLNYYFRDDMRFVSSYGRQFSPDGNENIWTLGLTYRLALPLWPGGGK
ncbi:MAG: OprO/OprP family phosphate-selective porin [Acidobacteriia bacterium]|nr:OprO/OprP family phosphate-selective porin [Terriglobia bacterium]